MIQPRTGALNSRPEHRYGWLWMLPVLLLAAFLAFRVINDTLLWLDEILTLRIAGGAPFGELSLPEALTNVVDDVVWPPLHTIAMYGWGRLAGWSPFAGRTLALLPGLIALALVYRLGRQMASERAGLLAALMLATSSFFLFYMTEMRGYTLYMAFTALGIWMYLHVTMHYERGEAVSRTAWLLPGLIGMLYTHYVAAALFGALLLYHLLFQHRQRGFNPVMRLFVIAVLLYLPWVYFMIRAVLIEAAYSRGVTESAILSGLYAFSNGMPLLIVGGLLYHLVFLRTRYLLFMLFWTVITLAVTLVVDRQVDFLFHLRHIVFMLIPVVLIIGLALAHLIRRVPAAGLLVLIWVVPGVMQSTTQDFMMSLPRHVLKFPVDLMTAVQSQRDCLTGSDTAMFLVDQDNSEQAYEIVVNYYFGDDFARLTRLATMQNIPDWLPQSTAPYSERLDTFLQDAPQVWFFRLKDVRESPEESEFLSLMQARYPYCMQAGETGSTASYLYAQEASVMCGQRTISLPACTENSVK